MECLDCRRDPFFTCCSFSWCRMHIADHLAVDGVHNYQKLVTIMNPLEKSILDREIVARIENLLTFKAKIAVQVKEIMKKLQIFCSSSNQKIDSLIQCYLQLSLKNRFLTSELEELKKITTTEMVLNDFQYEKVCRLIDDLQSISLISFENDSGKEKMLKTNKFLQTFNGGLNCIAVSNDQQMIFVGSEDTALRIWDIKSFYQLACLTEHKAAIWSIALSYDCTWAATGSLDKSVILWDVQKKRSQHIYTGHSDAVYCLSFSPDSTLIISGSASNQLMIWSRLSLQVLRKIENYSTIWCCLMTSDQLFFYAAGSSIYVLNLISYENIYSTKVHDSAVRSITKTKDDRFLVTCSADKSVKIWERLSMSLYANFLGHSQTVTSVSVTEDSNLVLSASCDETVIIWDLRTKSKVHQFAFHKSFIYGVVVVNDLIFTVSRDSRIGLARLSSKSFERFLNDKPFKTHSEVFSNEFVAFGSLSDVVIHPLTKNSADVLLKGHEGIVWAVCLSPSFRIALSSSQAVSQNLILWDLADFSLTAVLNGHKDSVFCVDISSDESLGMSGDAKSLIIVWDLKNFQVLMTLEGHSGFVYSVRFTKDARFAVSGGSDKLVIFWDLLEQRIKFKLQGHLQIIWKVFFTDDEKSLVSANSFEGIFVWSAENGNFLNNFRNVEEAKDWLFKNRNLKGELNRFLF